jgi:uncharacterized membrane protein
MTAITVPEPTAATVRTPSWKSGLVTGVIAAVATTVVAVAARAVGIPLDIQGEAIPILGFAQMVLLGTVIGIVLARHLARATFITATVVLTALSIVPDVLADTGTTKLTLALTHVVAAAIVIPRLAGPATD